MTKPMTREELENKASELVNDLEFMVELPYSRKTISEALEREVKPLLMEMAKLGIRYGFEKAAEETQKGFRLKNTQFVQTYVGECPDQWEPVLILTPQQLESEREQIARDAFEEGREWSWSHTVRDAWNFDIKTFEDYWQQKQKERIG